MPLQHIDKVNTLNKIEESALIQLVYVSTLTLKGRMSTSIFKEIKEHARIYNKQHNITGILCYGSGQFLQCIEGNKAQVLELKQRIFSDKRHKDIKILLLQVIDQRSFSDWRMRLLFLERWSWSPATKQQADQLSPFLPFEPHDWTPINTEEFIQVIRSFDTSPHIEAAGISYNAVGNMLSHTFAPHQAFLIVQGILILLLLITLMFFWL